MWTLAAALLCFSPVAVARTAASPASARPLLLVPGARTSAGARFASSIAAAKSPSLADRVRAVRTQQPPSRVSPLLDRCPWPESPLLAVFHARQGSAQCRFSSSTSVHRNQQHPITMPPADQHAPPPRYAWGTYPPVRRDESVVEELHGVKVADPYRWLEDPSSEETKAFVKAEADLTDAYLAQYPHRAALEASLTKMWDFERVSCPGRHGSRYFFFRNSGLQPQSVLYMQKDLKSEPSVFFDPNTLSEDGTVALSTMEFSDDGELFGYALSTSGSDWVTIHVKRVADGEQLSDKIEYAKFTSISWTKDNAGFFYTRYPKVENVDLGTETDANINAKTYFHTLGDEQSKDVLMFEDPDHPTYRAGIEASEDGEYLLLTVSASTAHKNKLWIAPWSAKHDPERKQLASVQWRKVVDDLDTGSFSYLTNKGPIFYFQSNSNAPNSRIVQYDWENPDRGFVDVVPEQPEVLEMTLTVDKDKLVLVYMKDVQHVMQIHDLKTGKKLRGIPLPAAVAIDGLSGKTEHTEFFFRYSGYLSPGTIMRYDCKADSAELWREISVPGFEPKEYEASQVFYPSKDGTKIPMFIVRRAGASRDRPTLLYGFVPAWLAFVRHFDGVLAVANIRGGGEYGEKWHEAGMRGQKQNVFDDFAAAARYLVHEKYTRPDRIAINGGSNGGLLVAACINQTPELFGAAVAEVGVLDMLRFHKWTIGAAWRDDYGDPDVADDFRALYKYSPYHNVKPQEYPATLLMTSDHDDRVCPVHTYKEISALQHANPHSKRPLLVHIERKAGHGAGKPTKKRIESAALKFSFIAMNTGAEWRD